MFTQKEIDSIKKKLETKYEDREKRIQKSREIIKLSKKIIYCIHRHDLKKAQALLKDIKRDISKLKKIAGIALDSHYRIAFQEYIEAGSFYEFITTGKIPKPGAFKCDFEEYLLGLADLTGELGRKAVLLAINKDISGVKMIHKKISSIHELFLNLDIRNSDLRKKGDSIKWNLKKVEEILYDLSLKNGF